jgi:hypothetical protein
VPLSFGRSKARDQLAQLHVIELENIFWSDVKHDVKNSTRSVPGDSFWAIQRATSRRSPFRSDSSGTADRYFAINRIVISGKTR